MQIYCPCGLNNIETTTHIFLYCPLNAIRLKIPRSMIRTNGGGGHLTLKCLMLTP